MSNSSNHSFYKMVHYFVSYHNYTFVEVQGIKEEVWLTNVNHPQFPIIRISPKPINTTFFEKDRITMIYNAIASYHQIDKKLLDIHTQVEAEEELDEDFIQVSINEKSRVPEFLLKAFSDIKMAFSNQEIPPKPTAKLKPARPKKKLGIFSSLPPVTAGILAIITAIFVLARIMMLRFEDPVVVSILLGSYYKILIVANYEFQRFLTAGFIHIDFLHFFMNSVALINLGLVVERIYGSKRFLIIFIVSVIMGSLFVFVGQGNGVVLGASGGLYGLMGALFVYAFESQLIKQPAIRNQFMRIMLVNLLISLMPSISLLGHLGGLIAGVLLAIIFSSSVSWASIRQHTKIAFIGFVTAVVLMGVVNKQVKPIYLLTDQRIVEYSQALHLNWYSSRLKQNLSKFYEVQPYELY